MQLLTGSPDMYDGDSVGLLLENWWPDASWWNGYGGTITVYSGSAYSTNGGLPASWAFTSPASGTGTVALNIEDPPSWAWVDLVDLSTGQSQALEPVNETNASGCPNYRTGTQFGNTSPYTFDIPLRLRAGHAYQFEGGGQGGYISSIQVTP